MIYGPILWVCFAGTVCFVAVTNVTLLDPVAWPLVQVVSSWVLEKLDKGYLPVQIRPCRGSEGGRGGLKGKEMGQGEG